MPRVYYCNLDCSKKTYKGWCKDSMAKITENEDGTVTCDSQKVPVKREQQTLF